MTTSQLSAIEETTDECSSILLGQFLRKQLLEHAVPAVRRTYARGDLIYGMDFPAEELFYLLEGRILISRFSHNGNAVILDYREAGEVVGELALCGISTRKTEARAVRRTEVLVIKVGRLLSAIQASQEHHRLIRCLGLELLNALELLEIFALDCVEHRLAKRLLRSARKTRELHPTERGTLDFSHEELAQMVGTTRQVVTQVMDKFRSAGLVEYARRQITIKEDQIVAFIQDRHLPS